MIETNICIVGAGPGGAAAALKLHQMGLDCTLLERATFPRDKVCGDAISGKTIAILRRISPEIIRRFQAKAIQQDIWGMRLVAPNRKIIDLPFKPSTDNDSEAVPGYVATRLDFDNFLAEEVRRCRGIDFREGVAVEHFEKTENGFLVADKDRQLEIKTKLLIVANGAQSAFSRKYAGLEKEPKHYAGGVRAYVSNVAGFHPEGFIELHFLKEYIPGYFWAFPLPDGRANIGLGMRTDYISKRKMNLKKTLLEIMSTHPSLKDRFGNAVLEGEIVGFPLPLGSKKYPISGENFMLVGDAGHLIDPLTGEGIGNAVYSGWIAAEQAGKCIESGDFSATAMTAYDTRVARVLYSEMKLSYQLQRMLAYPWLLNWFANQLVSNRKLMNLLSQMYTDFDLRRQLVKPSFWWKTVFSKAKD